MNRNTRNVVIASLLIVIAAGAIYYVRYLRPEPSKKAVRVAVNIPLTGPITAFSAPYPDALRFGIEEGCRANNLASDSFAIDFQDNAGQPSQAASVMQKQLLNGFDVYISGTTEMSAAIISEIDKTKTPHFLLTFDAYMTRKGPDRIRILPSYKIEGPLWVEYAKKRSPKRVFMITLNNAPIEEEFSTIVEPGIRQLGIEFQRERFEWETKEYRNIALKAKNYQPDLIFVNGYSVHVYPVLTALRSLDLVKDGSVLCVMDFVDLLHNDTPRAELVGVAFFSPIFEIPGAVPENGDWHERYKQRFGKRPTYLAAYAYDTGRILASAFAKKGAVTKESILSVLPYSGVSGQITLDADGDLASTVAIAKVTKDGKVEQIDNGRTDQ